MDVPVADGGARDDQEVERLPVADVVAIGVALPRVAHILQLQSPHNHKRMYCSSIYASNFLCDFLFDPPFTSLITLFLEVQ